jgi:threonine dehydrogenase-like Zn-dependent dehydrogenase
MGPYSGGQAEYLRVPYADFNCLQLPEDASEKETDYVMLSDIFPTGWHATRLACLGPGESIVIYGAGPVGLMAAMSARIQGASQVFVVDGQGDRLALAEKIGATPIDDKDGEIGDQIRDLTDGLGADCGTECVGYQRTNSAGKEVPNLVMNSLVDSVKATGHIGVVGVFIPEDPKASDKLEKKASSPSTLENTGSKARRWGRASAMSKPITVDFANSFIMERRIHPSSFRTSCLWLRHRPPTGTSTIGTTAGLRLFFTPKRRDIAATGWKDIAASASFRFSCGSSQPHGRRLWISRCSTKRTNPASKRLVLRRGK